jgi:hypothetical protein
MLAALQVDTMSRGARAFPSGRQQNFGQFYMIRRTTTSPNAHVSDNVMILLCQHELNGRFPTEHVYNGIHRMPRGGLQFVDNQVCEHLPAHKYLPTP